MKDETIKKKEQALQMALLDNQNEQERNRKKLRKLEKTVEEYQEIAQLEAKFYNDTYLIDWDSETASLIYDLMMDSEHLVKLGQYQLDKSKEQLLKEKKRLQEQEDDLEAKKRRLFQSKEDSV